MVFICILYRLTLLSKRVSLHTRVTLIVIVSYSCISWHKDHLARRATAFDERVRLIRMCKWHARANVRPKLSRQPPLDELPGRIHHRVRVVDEVRSPKETADRDVLHEQQVGWNLWDCATREPDHHRPPIPVE
eukprot:4554170-Prymnesium_polylepis.1